MIDSGSNSNGFYRIYNDGCIVQWGFAEKTNSNHSITLPKSYKSTNYFAIGLINSTSSSNNAALLSIQSKTNNSFVIRAIDGSTGAIKGTIGWLTIGY